MSISNNDVKAVAWDPKSPSTLLLPTFSDNSVEGVDSGQNNTNNFVMNYVLHDSGSGCNKFESSAIMNLLDARDAYLDEMKISRNNTNHHNMALCHLSREYRKALATCISEWSEDLIKREDSEEESRVVDDVALYLLRSTYAITHLSEIFLLLPSSQERRIDITSNIGYGYEDALWNLPGAVTADTVRYLRKHHLADIEDIFDPSVVENIFKLLQPDQYGHDDSDGSPYWDLVEAYMIRGCLEDAWTLLSHHSIARRFVEIEEQQRILQNQYNSNTNGCGLNDYQVASLAEDREGFRALKSILLSAPLPGGRNNDDDEGFDICEITKKDDQDGRNAIDNRDVVEEEFIEGIPTSAHRLWEISGEKNFANSRIGDYHINFKPNAAFQVHQNWKQGIAIIPSLQRLRRRIPQLNRLLSLLLGDFRDIQFGSWHEELCAELLYKKPNIRLMDMNVRAAALMQKRAQYNNSGMNDDNDRKDVIDEMVLTIMRGNAGEVVKALYEFGGGSGAALPAVVTALLSHLLGDANLLKNPSETYDLDTELLTRASSAIQSSLASEGYHDLGTRLAVRLLLPHIEIDSDLRITATLAELLEHHSPKSDSEANGILSLCRKLIERKNVRILDGCSSICLARHLHYNRERVPGGAVHWLLTGMDLESLVLCDGIKRSGDWQRALASGVCYRRLLGYFTETSRSLLKMILGEEKGASLFYARAKEMVAATRDESSNHNSLTSFIPAVKLLENITIIAGAIVERKDNSIVANSIVALLEERSNDEDDGAVSSLARSLNWDLLRLGIAILDMDAKRVELQEVGNKNNESTSSSFDMRGMGVLLSVFTVETKAQELKEHLEVDTSNFKQGELERSRLILGEGLKRAFVAENSMKKAPKSRRSKASGTNIYAANFYKHSREEQERAIQMMLEC